jgi:hypothetical protein
MKEAETLVQFMALKLDLQEAVEEIGRLAEAGFGKRPLLKKDCQVFGYQFTCRGIDEDRSLGLGSVCLYNIQEKTASFREY